MDLSGPLCNVDKPAMFGHFLFVSSVCFFWDNLYIADEIREMADSVKTLCKVKVPNVLNEHNYEVGSCKRLAYIPDIPPN